MPMDYFKVLYLYQNICHKLQISDKHVFAIGSYVCKLEGFWAVKYNFLTYHTGMLGGFFSLPT